MPGVWSLGNGVREIVTSGGERERRRARTPGNIYIYIYSAIIDQAKND